MVNGYNRPITGCGFRFKECFLFRDSAAVYTPFHFSSGLPFSLGARELVCLNSLRRTSTAPQELFLIRHIRATYTSNLTTVSTAYFRHLRSPCTIPAPYASPGFLLRVAPGATRVLRF